MLTVNTILTCAEVWQSLVKLINFLSGENFTHIYIRAAGHFNLFLKVGLRLLCPEIILMWWFLWRFAALLH